MQGVTRHSNGVTDRGSWEYVNTWTDAQLIIRHSLKREIHMRLILEFHHLGQLVGLTSAGIVLTGRPKYMSQSGVKTWWRSLSGNWPGRTSRTRQCFMASPLLFCFSSFPLWPYNYCRAVVAAFILARYYQWQVFYTLREPTPWTSMMYYYFIPNIIWWSPTALLNQ